MDILGVSNENIDVEMILSISKEGIDYFFDRLNKIDEEKNKDQFLIKRIRFMILGRNN